MKISQDAFSTALYRVTSSYTTRGLTHKLTPRMKRTDRKAKIQVCLISYITDLRSNVMLASEGSLNQ